MFSLGIGAGIEYDASVDYPEVGPTLYGNVIIDDREKIALNIIGGFPSGIGIYVKNINLNYLFYYALGSQQTIGLSLGYSFMMPK